MAELPGREVTRILLTVIVIGGLIAASLWILHPFLGAIIWAIMIVVATWPAMLKVQGWLGGRRWAAVTAMSIVLLLVLVVPLSAAIATIVSHLDDVVAWAKDLRDWQVPPPPSWVAGLPLVGARAVAAWQQVASDGVQVIIVKITPYAGDLTRWFATQMGSFGMVFLQFVLTVIAAAVLYTYGEDAADWALRFGARLGAERGEKAVRLCGQSIRGVARGVVVTALVQALIGGIGLAIAGVPFATLLTAVMFLLAVAQIGAMPILILADIWLFWSGATGWGAFLVVVTVIAGTLDNFLRPLLIKQGAADLPLLLIFIGVIGGLISFGLIGIFIGPLVLAVTHTLLTAWLYPDQMGPKSNTPV